MQKGTVIQTFGNKFAGIVNMRTEQWHEVLMVTGENVSPLYNVSPFALSGYENSELNVYIDPNVPKERVKLEIKKNFPEFLFNSHADWFVLDNSSALLKLFEIGDNLYTVVEKENSAFMNDYFHNIETSNLHIINPVYCDFSKLLNSYDAFIAAILNVFPPDRIILIRSNLPRYYAKRGEIKKTSNNLRIRAFVNKLDEYFLSIVGCIEIDATLDVANISDIDELRQTIEASIKSKISNENCLRIPEISSDARIITPNGSISDYIASGKCDNQQIADYFVESKYLIDDLLSAIELYLTSDNKNTFEGILASIYGNKSGRGFNLTSKCFRNNISTLKAYPFIDFDVSDVEQFPRLIVNLSSRRYVEFFENRINFFDTIPDTDFKYIEFIDNSYTCGIKHIFAALESWEMYFERGRRDDSMPFVLEFESVEAYTDTLYYINYSEILGNENFIIKTKKGKEFIFDNYYTKIDMKFFFDPDVRIVHICSGLADQMFKYAYLKKICEDFNIEKLYIDDFMNCISLGSRRFNVDLLRILPDNAFKHSFVTIFSERLKQRFIKLAVKQKPSLLYSGAYYLLGLKESLPIIPLAHSPLRGNEDLGGRNYKYPVYSFPKDSYETVQNLIGSAKGFIPQYIDWVPDIKRWPGESFTVQKACFERYFKFPKISENDIENKRIESLMLTKDAIVIHIRRTGHLKSERERNTNQYKISLQYVYSNLKHYNDKHLFVFSDDIDFCIRNAVILGFDIAGDAISYINANYHYNNYRDMQLISLGKVIIYSLGGFALCGALVSERVEYIVNANLISDETNIIWSRSEVN
jgi:hypothetical protein